MRSHPWVCKQNTCPRSGESTSRRLSERWKSPHNIASTRKIHRCLGNLVPMIACYGTEGSTNTSSWTHSSLLPGGRRNSESPQEVIPVANCLSLTKALFMLCLCARRRMYPLLSNNLRKRLELRMQLFVMVPGNKLHWISRDFLTVLGPPYVFLREEPRGQTVLNSMLD